MFGRLGRFVVHNPWKVIAAWLIVAVGLVAFGPKLSDISNQDTASFLPSKYESAQAEKLAEKSFPTSKDQTALIIFKRADGGPLTAADANTVNGIADSVKSANIERVTGVTQGQVSANRLIDLVSISIHGEAQDTKVNDAVKHVRDAIKPMMSKTDLKEGVTGGPAMMLDNQGAFQKAEAIVGIVTIVLILVLLLLIYRSPVAAFLPIVVVGVVAMVAPAVIAMAGKTFNFQVDQSLQTILIVVLFGIGTDYILFLLFRYRERLRAGDDRKQAMVVAVERVGEAIASAAGAVVIAFGAMLLASLGNFRSMGPGLAIAVIVMAIAGLTLVPAVVSLLGPKVFWPSKGWQKQPTGTTFQKLGRLTGRRPVAVALVSGIVMVALACGALGFKADYDQIGQLPSSTESAKAMKDMQTGFPPGKLNPTQVYVQSTTGAPLDKQAVETWAESLGTAPGVGEIDPVDPNAVPKKDASFSADGTVAQVKLVLKESPYTNKALDTIKPLRDYVKQNAPEGTKVVVGGATAQFTDVRTATDRDMSVIFPVAGLLIALILGLLLRSLVAPWYLMLAVVLGYAGTLGATVLVFQGLLNKSGVMFMLPIMIYMFVVAIGTDYNILMVARLREEAQEGHEPRKAAALAVEHAGPSIAAAGVILAGTFASLMLAGVSMMTEMGFAVSIGICISAFLMSMFLVPSVTALIGHKAWWPGHADRAKQHGQVGGDERESVLAGDR